MLRGLPLSPHCEYRVLLSSPHLVPPNAPHNPKCLDSYYPTLAVFLPRSSWYFPPKEWSASHANNRVYLVPTSLFAHQTHSLDGNARRVMWQQWAKVPMRWWHLIGDDRFFVLTYPPSNQALPTSLYQFVLCPPSRIPSLFEHYPIHRLESMRSISSRLYAPSHLRA